MKLPVLFVIVLLASMRLGAQSWFATGQDADVMLSGVDFNNTGGAFLYNHPSGLASDGTRFLLCDRFNNRVLVWNLLPTQWNSPPDLVVGQPNFTANNPGTTKSNLNWPGNASAASNGVLVIADTENDRILLWNQFPTQNGQAASIEIKLTQLGIGNCEWPWGVWTNGTKLAATSTRANVGILFWNSLPTADNQPPDYVIRLPQFGTPRNISSDGSTYFFVGDHNARVNGDRAGTFFWNSYPTAANQPYDFYRDEWIKGVKLLDGKLVAGGLMNLYIWNTMPTTASQNPDVTIRNNYYSNGDGVDAVFAGGRLYVNNYNGNNVHVYNSVPTTSTAEPNFALGSSAVNINTLDSINYIQNPVLASDGTRLFASSGFDRELWIWNAIPTTSGAAPSRRISLRTVGFDSEPKDNALHNGKLVVAGQTRVAIWESLPLNGEAPTRIFTNTIGSATFQDLRGVALDSLYLYLADGSGQIFVWIGLPVSGGENPFRTLTVPGVALNNLHSDGTYFCATVQGTSITYIYRVADIAASTNPQPWRTVGPSPQLPLNLTTAAITFNGSFAIANTNGNAVYAWRNVTDAGDPTRVIVLGQSSLANIRPAIGVNRLFMPAALLSIGNALWVGEIKFSSRILKFSYAGATALDEKIGEPKEFALEQNYPNPFNPTTRIRFGIPVSGFVSLKVFDVLGREVATLVNEPKAAGKHTREFDASSLASGMYFYRLTSDGFTSTKRMLVLK
jgi:hypothetical protein